jgi:MFS family permease
MNKIVILVILTIIICINAFYIIREYSYVETDERLTSDLLFKKYLFQTPIKGYLFVFLFLSIIIGFSCPIIIPFFLEYLILTIILLGFLIYFGVLLDNRGRKWTFTAGLLTLMILFLFKDLYFIEIIYNEFFLGISISLVFTLIFTFAGDFATERNKIKYRARILSILLIILMLGFICGMLFNGLLNILNIFFPEMIWFSTLLNIMSFVLIIISLVRMMPLPEILSAKEADWAETINNIYIFNKDSICLYNKDFNSNSDEDDSLCEDLVTSGFTGIIGLVSEITNEQKNLRIIDKERVKIYFTYGKYVNIALISTKFLPILFKKMQIFMKAFEKRFEAELKDFNGNINVFLKETNHIIQKYFK